MIKVCVITSSRADYGLLKRLLTLLNDSPLFQLQLVVTGTHLSCQHGLTSAEIEEDGFQIDQKLEILVDSDSDEAIAKSFGLGIMSYSSSFRNLGPELILILGDRFEILAAAT